MPSRAGGTTEGGEHCGEVRQTVSGRGLAPSSTCTDHSAGYLPPQIPQVGGSGGAYPSGGGPNPGGAAGGAGIDAAAERDFVGQQHRGAHGRAAPGLHHGGLLRGDLEAERAQRVDGGDPDASGVGADAALGVEGDRGQDSSAGLDFGTERPHDGPGV
ncbi:hypothetical protein ACIQWA_03875 [Kitasatospora sp. NPDC098652]|uniref:hypothetical protein n=1 Tax=Kitasatospora sp. NPDC098652 TaxID=3364095 RepID=UPI00381C7503